MKKFKVSYFDGIIVKNETVEGEGQLKGVHEKIKINRWELINTVLVKPRGRKSKIEKG